MCAYWHHIAMILNWLTSQITGSKKQSDEEREAALFAVRVHLPCYTFA